MYTHDLMTNWRKYYRRWVASFCFWLSMVGVLWLTSMLTWFGSLIAVPIVAFTAFGMGVSWQTLQQQKKDIEKVHERWKDYSDGG